MKLKLETLTETHAKEICNWEYEGDYSIYNYPEWDKVCSQNWAVSIEEKRKSEFSAVVDDNNNFCGYIRIVNMDSHVIIGVGLKPDICGQGLGSELMKLVKEQCKKLYPNKKIVLEVRSFNKRAINCYKRSGFKITDEYKKDTPIGFGEFLKMEFTY